MSILLIITLLFSGLLNFVLALPATSNDLTAPHPNGASVEIPDLVTINGTSALLPGLIQRDPNPGWCNVKIGLLEHFPRSPNGRRASIFVSGLWDGKGKDIHWEWDNGTPAFTNGRPTERRIDYGPIRIFDFIRRGDALTFSWYHPDDGGDVNKEWMDFDFNNNKWNDRDTDCKKRHCCKTGSWYDFGKDRRVRAIGCGFPCP